MHPVTGAFADPAHELAFAAHFFRLCFGWHMVSMALLVFTPAWVAILGASSTEPMSWLLLAFWWFLELLGLMIRVALSARQCEFLLFAVFGHCGQSACVFVF